MTMKNYLLSISIVGETKKRQITKAKKHAYTHIYMGMKKNIINFIKANVNKYNKTE